VDRRAGRGTPQPPGRESLREQVKAEPLIAVAIAAAAGFLVGGGAKNRIGLARLGVAGRIAPPGRCEQLFRLGSDRKSAQQKPAKRKVRQ
jgi:hypothetical protein